MRNALIKRFKSNMYHERPCTHMCTENKNRMALNDQSNSVHFLFGTLITILNFFDLFNEAQALKG